mmetsp:Transcript_16295/g.54832  ORF Transcript_16295/g.54832 Transcript_16295/m.54832 type:complete len:225 (-) Transcript_16295:456-1130(-)
MHCSYRSRRAPGRSSRVTLTKASVESARSATKRRRSKSMLDPEVVATKVQSREPVRSMNLRTPATARAPAGSWMVRVSLKMDFIAAHTSSLLTVTMSSTSAEHTRKVSLPTVRTAAPSTKRPTESRVTGLPARRLSVMPAASSDSTPMTITDGRTRLTYAAMPESIPPPPQQTKMASRGLPVVCLQISIPMVPCPAITKGSSNGWMSAPPVSRTMRLASAWASS